MTGDQPVLRGEGLTWQQVTDVLNGEGLRPRSAARWSGRNVSKVAAAVACG